MFIAFKSTEYLNIILRNEVVPYLHQFQNEMRANKIFRSLRFNTVSERRYSQFK